MSSFIVSYCGSLIFNSWKKKRLSQVFRVSSPFLQINVGWYLNLAKVCFLLHGLFYSLFTLLLTQIPLKLNLEVSWNVTPCRLVNIQQSIRCYLTENMNLQCQHKKQIFSFTNTKYTNHPYFMRRSCNSKHVRRNGSEFLFF